MGTTLGRADQTPTARDADILNDVRTCIAQLLMVDLEQVTPSTELVALGADSFDFLNLALELEAQYRISLPSQYAAPGQHDVQQYAFAVSCAIRAVERRMKLTQDTSTAER